MEYHNTFHIIWYNITIWFGNIAILYGTTYSLLKYSYNTVGLRRISFFSEICSPRSVTTFFAQTPPPPSTKNAPTAQPLSACVLYISLFYFFNSDNGKEFIARVVVDLLKESNPNCYIVTGRPRTPRDQGSVESATMVVRQVLKCILSENCFYCHGQDGNKRKAGLRLDVREEAVKAVMRSI